MGKNIIISYLEDEYWTAKTPQEIRIVPLAHRKTVHGISIFFSAEDYRRTWEDYEEIKTIVFTVSKGAAWVNTLLAIITMGTCLSSSILPTSNMLMKRPSDLSKKLSNFSKRGEKRPRPALSGPLLWF